MGVSLRPFIIDDDDIVHKISYAASFVSGLSSKKNRLESLFMI